MAPREPATKYFYGSKGTETVDGGSGHQCVCRGKRLQHVSGGLSGTDYIYGSSGTSNITGGTGTEFLFTGTHDQTFTAGSGADYFYEEPGTQSHGKLDTINNFQIAGGLHGTFIFMPRNEAASTSFVAGAGGTYIVTPLGGGGASDILVANELPLSSAHRLFSICNEVLSGRVGRALAPGLSAPNGLARWELVLTFTRLP